MSERVLPPGIERHGNRFRVVKKVHGTLVRRSFTTLEEAKSFLADLRSRIHRERRLEDRRAPGALTVGDLVERWFATHRKRLQPATEFDYEWRIRHDISKIAHHDVPELIRDPSILHSIT